MLRSLHFKPKSHEQTSSVRVTSVLRFVTDHSLDPDDVACPAAGVAPSVVDPPVGLPVLHGDAFRPCHRAGAVGAEAGHVRQVGDPVGIPPVGASDASLGHRITWSGEHRDRRAAAPRTRRNSGPRPGPGPPRDGSCGGCPTPVSI